MKLFPARLTNRVMLSYSTKFAALLGSGLFSGFLVAVLVLEMTLRDFDAAVYTHVRLVELQHLDDLATVLLPPSLLAAAVLALMLIRQPGRVRWFAVAAVLLLAVTFTISASVSVPINNDQLQWSAFAPPSNWSQVRDRWQIAHIFRTSTATAAFALLIAAVLPQAHTKGDQPALCY